MSDYGYVHVWGDTAMAYRKAVARASDDPLSTLEQVLAVLDERTQRIATLEHQLAEVTAERDVLSRLDHNRARANELLIAERDTLRTALRQCAEACRTFHEWLKREDEGPQYPTGTTRNDPKGELIWKQWYYGNIDICGDAQDKAREALAIPVVQDVLKAT